MALTMTKDEREAFLPTFMWPSSALRKMVTDRSWFRFGIPTSREARSESQRTRDMVGMLVRMRPERWLARDYAKQDQSR